MRPRFGRGCTQGVNGVCISRRWGGLASWEEVEDTVVMTVTELTAIDLLFKCDDVKGDVVEVIIHSLRRQARFW